MRYVRVCVRVMHAGYRPGGVVWKKDVPEEELEATVAEALPIWQRKPDLLRLEVTTTPPTIANALVAERVRNQG